MKNKTTTFEVKLGQAYFNKGFFNVNQEYSELFGIANQVIQIHLVATGQTDLIFGYVNRTANPNGSPRIMAGKDLTSWIQNNYKLGDIMKVEVIDDISIRILK